MRPVSPDRAIENAQRAVLMTQKFGPRWEWTCSFTAHRSEHPEVEVGKNYRRCWGPINGHEIIKRSRGGSIVDMDNVVLLCSLHNSWVEDHPHSAHRLGLADHSWDRLAAVAVSPEPDTDKLDAAMKDFAEHTTPGGTWIEDEENR